MNLFSTALILLAFSLTGCGQHEVREPTPTPWEDSAKGYRIEGSYPVFGSGRYVRRIEESTNQQLFDFTLSIGPISTWSDTKKKVTHFWGWGEANEKDEGLREARHVREISLTVHGAPVDIREAAYVDLIDLRSDGRPLRTNGPRLLLYMEGADAGESYRLRFTIENHRVIKREIWKGEFPELGPIVTIFESNGAAPPN